MSKNYTHITVLLDRTGSMDCIRDDIIGGFNAFLDKQKAQPGEATLTLVQFDSQNSYEIMHRFAPIADIPALSRDTYVPRASTPLLDTIGRGINDLESSLADIKKNKRPSQIMMVIVTDGQENASVEFKRDQIKKMIKQKTDNEDWQFVFLSAGLISIQDAESVGIQGLKTLLFQQSTAGTREAFFSLSERTSAYRSKRSDKMEFMEEDRKHELDPNSKKFKQ